MEFEWDSRKAEANKTKHRISFEQAITAFDDPFALIVSDDKHSGGGENRQWLIGEADIGVLVIVFTIRQPGSFRRIISARRAGRKERIRYENYKNFPI